MKLVTLVKKLKSNLRNQRLHGYLLKTGKLLQQIPIGKYIINTTEKKIALIENEQKDLVEYLTKLFDENSIQNKNKIDQLKNSYTYLIYSDKNMLLKNLNNTLNNLNRLNNQKYGFPEKLYSKMQHEIEKSHKQIKYVEEYNSKFINNEKSAYKSLWRKSSFELDDEQLTAIVTDDKHNLVVAGAGSGKTEVLITRIAYLVRREHSAVNTERILALAFQRKAAGEVSD
ncbi:MAG: UvrD-helicase domain-containing protein, partial [Spirochaetes bacterium]|nr:UvrD-helicase domain-containing protein [Spirochaetota bacterium]